MDDTNVTVRSTLKPNEVSDSDISVNLSVGSCGFSEPLLYGYRDKNGRFLCSIPDDVAPTNATVTLTVGQDQRSRTVRIVEGGTIEWESDLSPSDSGPTIVNETVYVADGPLYALDTATGNVR